MLISGSGRFARAASASRALTLGRKHMEVSVDRNWFIDILVLSKIELASRFKGPCCHCRREPKDEVEARPMQKRGRISNKALDKRRGDGARRGQGAPLWRKRQQGINASTRTAEIVQ
jgi:hypothetical protein